MTQLMLHHGSLFLFLTFQGIREFGADKEDNQKGEDTQFGASCLLDSQRFWMKDSGSQDDQKQEQRDENEQDLLFTGIRSSCCLVVVASFLMSSLIHRARGLGGGCRER